MYFYTAGSYPEYRTIDNFFTNGTWVHIAVSVIRTTGDNATIKIYKDGILVLTYTNVYTRSVNTHLHIGAGTHSTLQPLSEFLENNSMIDDIRMYHTVLTDSDITAIYNE